MDKARYWLVVENEENDFMLFRRACRSLRESPSLLWLSNGIQARSYLSERDPWVSVIVSDLVMPQMNGLELVKWVRTEERLRDIPFFILSGWSRPIYVEQAFGSGADDYRVKPTNPELLKRIVSDWAERCVRTSYSHRRDANTLGQQLLATVRCRFGY